MNLLGSANYDPAVAVVKATSALLAMTAVDTTNLRLAITVPAHGKVLFRLKCAITGATTLPAILLGVMNGATVLGRQVPTQFIGTASAATQNALAVAEFVATGLTPGAMNVDAAYAVQVIVAVTNIKYGGPNTNAGANAWGGFVFEAWDPVQPTNFGVLSIDASGRVDVGKVTGTAQTARDLGASVLLSAGTGAGQLDFTAGIVKANVTQLLGTAWLAPAVAGTPDVNTKQVGGTAQTARDLGAQLDAAVSSRMATYTQPTGFLAATFPAGTIANTTNITAGTIATVTNLTNAPTAGDLTATMKTSVTTAATAATPTVTLAGAAVQAIWDALTTALTTVGSIGKRLADSIDATVSSRLPTASYVAPLTAAGTRTAVGLATANLDTQLSLIDLDVLTRSTYAGGDTAGTTTLLTRVPGIVQPQTGDSYARLGAPTGASHAADVAAVKSDSAAIKLQTDKLLFNGVSQIAADIKAVVGMPVSGAGTLANPWGP
jgi:hypothetical protein